MRQAKRWHIKEFDKRQAATLARGLGVSPVVAGLLVARGYADERAARGFLAPSLEQLHDPARMLGMSEAAARVQRAVGRGEKILIYGDYDVDGTTGTVVLRRALQMLGAQTGYHVPHRFTEGYGIRQDILERAKAKDYGLVISVDCGIRAHEPLVWAQENGLDVIITDHHLPDADEGPPPALAVLNPNQPACPYPDKNLAGVGVAFKLADALFRAKGWERKTPGFLKIVALGTIADMADLTGENRAIVALGLADLTDVKNLGLRALMEVAGCGAGDVSTTDVGFRLGPRINAAGRMDAARAVVELFEATDWHTARRLAQHLDERNRERQLVQAEIVALAEAEFAASGGMSAQTHVAVIVGDGWHRGVIGLAASRITERIHRPSVVISLDAEGLGHGSARSIEAYHLLNGLTACADLFVKFGGHSHAAGLTIRRENVAELRRRLNEHAAAHLADDELTPVVEIDAELAPAEATLDLVNELQKLEPYGMGHPRPVFATRGLRLTAAPFVMKDRHLKLRLSDGYAAPPLEAVWWDGVRELGQATLNAQDRIELAYSPEANTWRGDTRLQLVVKDLRKLG
jgi:single-stranded-DNA-specific exonuclease